MSDEEKMKKTAPEIMMPIFPIRLNSTHALGEDEGGIKLKDDE